MNPLPAALLTASLSTLGRWSAGKKMTIDIVIGLVVIAVSLSILYEINKEFARIFGVLIVVSTLVWHGNNLFKALTSGVGKRARKLEK